MAIKTKSKQQNTNCKKDNEIFMKILDSNPEIKILDLKPDGDFVFVVPITDAEITFEMLDETPMAQTVFFANFTGELFVRRNFWV